MASIPPHERRGPAVAAAIVLGVALPVLAWLLADLLLGGPLTRADPLVSRWFADHRTAPLTAVFLLLSLVHSTLGIEAQLALAVVVLLVGRRWRTALWLVPCIQGAMLLNVLLKHAIGRARPDAAQALEHLASASFPSGHAVAATAWWACVAWLLVREGGPRWRRVAVVAGAALLVGATCLSRVYLGVHYPTDVVAGICVGLAWVAAWALARRSWARRAVSAGPPAGRPG